MAKMQTLRVATFNIKHAATRSGYIGRPGLLAEACAEIDADILALQEVDRHVWRSGFTDLVLKAAGVTYTDATFGKAMGANPVSLINPGGAYGLALLVKGRIKSQDVIPLKGDYVRFAFGKRRNIAPEPRIATFSEVETESGITARVVNTHIGGPRREEFVGAILDRLMQYPEPHILLGDYNTGRQDMHRWLGATALPLEFASRPLNLSMNSRQSDHIAVNGFTIDTVTTQRFALSDHPAIIAELSTAVS